MKFLKYLSIFLFGTLSGFLVLYLLYQNNLIKVESEPHYEKVNFSLNKDVSVYLPWWDQDRSFETIKENRERINIISAFWYEAKDDGSIKKYTGAENKEIKKFSKETEIKLIPVINNDQDPETAKKILTNGSLRSSHIDNIIKLVLDNDYDGIEVDYENMEAEERDNFSLFIDELSQKIHQNNKILAVAVHAKTTDEGTWKGPASQDWKALANVCDQIKIMAYDYHWSTSEAGDIAPVSWINQVAEYAKGIIPMDKIYLGLNFYGYDWIGEKGRDMLFEDVQKIILEKNPEIKLSDEKEKYFSYIKEDKERTVYFADSETIVYRLNIVNSDSFKGVSIWRIGGEDPKNWNTIEKTF